MSQLNLPHGNRVKAREAIHCIRLYRAQCAVASETAPYRQATVTVQVNPWRIAQQQRSSSLRNRPHNRPHFSTVILLSECCTEICTDFYIYLDLWRFVLFSCTTAVWQFAINEYVMSCYVSVHCMMSSPGEPNVFVYYKRQLSISSASTLGPKGGGHRPPNRGQSPKFSRTLDTLWSADCQKN